MTLLNDLLMYTQAGNLLRVEVEDLGCSGAGNADKPTGVHDSRMLGKESLRTLRVDDDIPQRTQT